MNQERNVLEVQREYVEDGVEEIIHRYLSIRNELNQSSANSLDETKKRLRLIYERDTIDTCLRYLNIQSYELDQDKYNAVKLI